MKEQITEVLRTEGIMSQGFGISPKILFRDKRLTPEAKAIYGYLASFAGSGKTAFPGRNLMLEELGISSKRYYKHLDLLIQSGYIKIEKTRDKYGSFARNIYTLVNNPIAVKEGDQEAIEVTAVKSEAVGENDLRKSMAIDEIISQQPEDRKYLEKIYMVAKDMETSDEIKVGGSVRQKDRILRILDSLSADSTRVILHNFKNAISKDGHRIFNVKAYLQTLICNSSYEVDLYIDQQNKDQEKKALKLALDQKKEEEQNTEQLLKEIYIEHPEIDKLDKEYNLIMRGLSKTILSGNEIEREKLLKKKEKLETQRERYILEHNLPEII